MATRFLRIPDDITACQKETWRQISPSKYQLERWHLLLVYGKGRHTVKGPVIHEQELPRGTEFKFESKRSLVRSYSQNITSSIQQVVAQKTMVEVAATQGAEAFVSLTEANSKVSGILQHKLAAEFSAALTEQLTYAHSFEVVATEELMTSLTLKIPENDDPSRRVVHTAYLRLWPCTLDIYLVKTETLNLEYRKEWFFWQVRNSFVPIEALLKIPLARLSYYEPEEAPSFSEDYTPEVNNADEITVGPLTAPCPSTVVAECPSLEDLASIAFPVNAQERADRTTVLSTAAPKSTPKERFLKSLSHKGTRAGASAGKAAKSASTIPATKTGAARRGDTKTSISEAGPKKSVSTRSGAAKSGAAKSGAAKSGAAKSGAAKSGAAKSGAAKSGAAKSGAAKSGAAKSGAAKSGAAKSGAAKSGAAKSGAAKSGAAKSGAAKSGAAR